jgi:hypothetical protein
MICGGVQLRGFRYGDGNWVAFCGAALLPLNCRARSVTRDGRTDYCAAFGRLPLRAMRRFAALEPQTSRKSSVHNATLQLLSEEYAGRFGAAAYRRSGASLFADRSTSPGGLLRAKPASAKSKQFEERS